MNETLDLIRSHRSIRKFKDQSIEEATLKALIEAGQSASTSSFIQAYTIIRVNDSKVREEIAQLSGEQSYVVEAPEFLVFCPDLNRLGLACDMNGEKMEGGYTEAFVTATIDAALVSQNVMIAAESLGLGGVYIGGIRNDPKRVSELLNIPNYAYPAFGMCLGYPDEKPEVKPRLSKDMILMEDIYSTEGDREKLAAYDDRVRDYYRQRTGGRRDISWTQHMTKKMSKELRPHMKAFLESKGFMEK